MSGIKSVVVFDGASRESVGVFEEARVDMIDLQRRNSPVARSEFETIELGRVVSVGVSKRTSFEETRRGARIGEHGSCWDRFGGAPNHLDPCFTVVTLHTYFDPIVGFLA